ncbi:NAD(P)-dependent oxidoreductase [Mannheimia haemolytica]|uniref:NAD(P)-dependent oxidoreductase n=1 Tax=Mannheimia haemolytica TaxID=75985 RepID=UPI000588C93B|nr:NAD(P)-dependent oxidoreductase [Mannheimia haemolytica]AJE06963.1 NAD(P)-dependent oxidoreductase [Mannheimia haemolytica USDA-ARS-USMARC-184]KYL06077.1 3-hydroxyacid dehydrogenase [Mannheimia haemolytica]UFK43239.1 NAD(P)-dependent oxidoreductase [Mannheimia haemolytica]UQX62983.1 NAD(P)-dependent oxidoreductase [Mannheimia haemolytica]HDL1114049.1 NAD(P)-dependent oxidoreductase [Mannheimia haemolytica]
MKNINTQAVGWIGLGQMGEPMAKHLLNSGVNVGVYNRDPAKAEKVVEAGGTLYPSVLELVKAYDVIFLMIADYAAVQQVLSDEVLAELNGKVVVNMSTISPSQNQAVEALLAQHGAEFVEAPVSGSSKVAEAGKLLVLAAGKEETVELLKPLFAAFSTTTFYYGEVGKAGGIKLMINSLLGIFIQAYGEALNFADQYGIPKEKVIEMISGSFMNSPIFQAKVPMYQANEFPPAFMMKHMTKDFNLAREEIAKLGKSYPLIEQATKTYNQANDSGLSEVDMAAIYQFLAK